MKPLSSAQESWLKITTSADRTSSSVELKGSSEEHLYNLMLLTRDTCKVLNIPPFVMAGILVESIARYETSGNAGEIMMDLSAMNRGHGTDNEQEKELPPAAQTPGTAKQISTRSV